MTLKVCSIDVGIVNMGLVGVNVDLDADGRLPPKNMAANFTVCDRIDITQTPHTRVPRCECKLYHSKGLYDRVSHFLQEYAPVLDACDVLLIERQPLQGLVAVQELVLGHYRDKTVLISPNAMHKFYGIDHFTYDGRKTQTVAIAAHLLEHHHEWLGRMQKEERQHDIADAIAQMYFYLAGRQKKDEEAREKEARRKEAEKLGTLENPFAKFRYKGSPGT